MLFEEIQVLHACHFFLFKFSKKVNFQDLRSPVYREASFIAQVSPGVTRNSLRGLSTQAILMGIPFPHTLGCPVYAGTAAANTPFTKAWSIAFVW